MGASDKKEICQKVESMTPEQIWMRNPLVQCEEELLIYEEIIEFILLSSKILVLQPFNLNCKAVSLAPVKSSAIIASLFDKNIPKPFLLRILFTSRK